MNKTYIFYFLYFGLAIVYGFGLFLPLMQNDSAQHATMAMRMYLENDFLNIIKGTETPYLDKPHLHFWLSAISFKLFGISEWAYRLPSLIFTIIGAFSVYRLAKNIFNKETGIMASLIFLSSQSIILANHDVRTDTILTGSIAVSIWQFHDYFRMGRWKNIVFGFIFLSFAYMSKGLLGVCYIGCIIFIHVSINKYWYRLFSYRFFAGILVFLLFSLPMFIAYYNQFGWEGVRFIVWDQIFNRLTANGFKESSPDYFFFFHSLLWVFIPFSVVAYCAVYSNIKEYIVHKKNKEHLFSTLGVFLILLVISTSKFKLPHYLNSLLPILSIPTANYLMLLHKKSKWTNIIHEAILYILIVLSVSLVLFFGLYVFPIPNLLYILLYCILIIFVFYFLIKLNGNNRIFITSICITIFLNVFLNSHLYPNLLKYQSGFYLAPFVKENNIIPENTYLFNGTTSWTYDFSMHRNTPTLDKEELNILNKTKTIYLIIKESSLEEINDMDFKILFNAKNYRVSVINSDNNFFNPETRDLALKNVYLVKVINHSDSLGL